MVDFVMAVPVIVAGVLLAAGLAKLRAPDTLAGWTELGIPEVFRRDWLLRLHPLGELLLAVLLVLTGGWIGTLAAVVTSLLFAAYLALVVRTVRHKPGASCSCFGTRRPITAVTVARNTWFLLLALAAAAVLWAAPMFGGAIVVLGADWGWMIALAGAALTVWLSVWHPADAPAEAGVPIMPGAADAAVDGDPAEYVRARTPAVPITLADGSSVNLRELVARGPVLLLAVTESCGSCAPAIEAMPRWRALLPEVSVRFLLTSEPGASGLTDRAEPQSIHDPERLVRASIADWPTPTALLIGADGYLAGGPVSGYDAIDEFIADVYEVLHGERPPHSTSTD